MHRLNFATAALLGWSVLWRTFLLLICGLAASALLLGTLCYLLKASLDSTRTLGFISGAFVAILAEGISIKLVAEKLLFKFDGSPRTIGSVAAVKLWWGHFWRNLLLTSIPLLAICALIFIGFWAFYRVKAEPLGLDHVIAYTVITVFLLTTLLARIVAIKLVMEKLLSKEVSYLPRGQNDL